MTKMEIGNPAIRWSSRLGWGIWGFAILLYVGDVILLLVNGPAAPLDPSVPFAAGEDFAFVLVATLALTIIRSQPGNKVGWWIMVAGVSTLVESFSVRFANYGLGAWGKTALVVFSAWLVRWVWVAGQVNIPFTLLYYPNGELPTRRWRGAEIAMWVVVIATVFIAAFSPGASPETAGLDNPVAISALSPIDGSSAINMVVFAGLNVLPLFGLVSLVARFRQASPVVRQQLKLIFWVAIVSALFFLGTNSIELSPEGTALLDIAFTVFVAGMITASIVRFGLFDIDRLISRTVSYAVVVGALAAVIFGIVSVLTLFLPSDNPIVVAASTLTVFVLFNPLRRRTQRWVDRRFNRTRYDAEKVADRFARSLRNEIDPNDVITGWVEVVGETMEPSAIGVWLRDH